MLTTQRGFWLRQLYEICLALRIFRRFSPTEMPLQCQCRYITTSRPSYSVSIASAEAGKRRQKKAGVKNNSQPEEFDRLGFRCFEIPCKPYSIILRRPFVSKIQYNYYISDSAGRCNRKLGNQGGESRNVRNF